MKNYYKKTTFTVLVLVNFILQITSFQAKAQYCVAPQYTLGSGCGYNFYMSDFQFAGISNTTTCSTIAPYYNYYITMTATVEQNGGYSVSMSFPTISPYLAYFKMYIDYNDNNSFEDAGEEVYNSGNLANLTSIANGYVVIPVDAPLGTHRLRVRCADGDVNSCTDDGTIGEVEDYNVTIQPQPLTANAGYSQYPTCSQSTITIGGFPSATGGTGPYTYSWSPSTNLDDTTSSNPTLTVIPTTTYSASVTYTLTVTDANNNTASSIAFINLPYTSATANAGNDMSDCRQQLFGFEGTGSGTYFHWDFGDGGSADVQDATTYDYSYVAPGYYNAILTVTDYNGCAARDTIIVHAKGPDVNAGGDSYHYYSVCGTVVDFASATTNGESYYWAFGCDCVSNPNLNPVFDYQNYGSYVATLYATDNDGCENSSSATISLNEVPHANAGVDQTVCPGTRVFLGDDTSVGQMNWWEFGDGNTGYGLLTENTYAAVGTYYAVLSSGFDNTCGTSIDTAIITVAEPFVDFGGDRSVCGLTVDFVANAPSAISYSWSFSDGTTSTEANPSHTFNYYGTFSVTLSITTANGCTASTTANITLDQPPYANAGLDVTTCAGAQTILDGWYSNGITYSWDFGDGQTYVGGWNGTNIYANGGTYYATMTVSNQNSCPDAVDTTVVTVHQPTADAGSDQTLCFNGGVISFVGTSTDATSYAWNFGDGYTDTLQNTTHTYPYASTFPVSFTAYNGSCSATSYFNAILDLPPYANAGADLTACAGVETTLNAYYSTGTSYTWNFGDGQSYNDWVGSNTYTNGGTYYATMTVSNQNSCPDAVDTTVVTVHQPTADAGSDQTVCFNGGVISFVGTSTDATSYAWNFGDGYTDTLQNTTHTYPYASTFPVSFTAYNGSCSAIAYFNATLDLPPVANAGLDVSACAGVETTFSAYYSNGATYSWNFGDGQSYNDWVGSNTYTNGGTYYATMTVSNQNACPDAVDTTVVTVHQPTADAGADQTVCFNGGVISFVGTSTDATSYAWNFGDGYTDTLQNTTHTYPYASTFPVSFTAYNGSCSATANFYAYVDAAPVADAGLDVTACAGVLTTLNAYYSTGTSYTWNFGDGQSYNDWVGSNTYTNGGTYYATMTVSNQNACPDAVDTTVVTVHQPTADAGADQTVCFNGGVISFNGVATDATSYLWNFGDGNTDTLQNPSFNYTYAGTYNVTFNSYYGSCSATSSFTANVIAPNSGTQYLTICSGQNVVVGSSTYATSGTYTDVLTSINGCDSTVTTNLTVNPALSGAQTLTICAGTNISVGSNTYSASGTYNDILITTSGCDSVVTTILTVSPAITGTQSLTICDGATVTIGTNTYSTTGVYNDVLTAFEGCDSTLTTTLIVNPAITNTQSFTICGGNSVSVGSNNYTSSGTYVDVFVSSYECDSTVTTILTVNPLITNSQIITLCAGVSVTVGINMYNTSGTYSDTLSTSSGCDSIVTTNLTMLPSITGSQTLVLCAGSIVSVGTSSYTSSGVFTDILSAFNGCDSTVTTNLTINPIVVNSQSYNLCAGGSITVGSNTYSVSGVYTDVFTAFNGCDSTLTTNLSIGSSITGSQSLTVCPGGTVTVGTNIYSTNGIYVDTLAAFAGCDSIVTTNLTVVVQLAAASLSVNTCYGVSQTLSVNGGSGTIYWSPAVGLNTNVGNSVVASPLNTTMYYVTDTVGACQMIDSTLLTVNPLITADAGAHQSLCLGDTATFVATGTGGSGTYTYSWSDGVNSYSTDTISIVPSSNLTFTLTITDAAVCSATDTVTFSSRHTDIYGLITYSGGILSHGTNNKAVLYRWYNPNLAQFDTMQVSSIDTVSGYFHFTNVYNNNLLIKVFPDTSIYSHHFVPSYYNAANSPTSLWDSTTFFTHTCNAEDTLNIVMVENQTLSGSGHISGRLVQGPFFSPLANGMPRVQGDPIPGGDVKIGNNPGGQMIAATTTSSLDSPDGGGYYHFDSIPVGHYDIYIDIPGLLRDSVWTIDITPTDTVYTNLDYWVDSSDIYPINPDINVQTPTIKGLESTFIVYPNPFRTNATIEYTVSHDAQVKLEVYSMIGDKINTLVNNNQQTGKYKFNLNTSNRKLSNGVYFIKLTLGNDSFTKRVVVIE